MRRTVAALALAAFTFGCVPGSTVPTVVRSDTTSQPAWEFPERVGSFTRMDVTRDPAKREVIAEYMDAPSRHIVTVYVYPAAPTISIGATGTSEAMFEVLLRDEFEGSKRAIEVNNPSVRLQSSGAATVQQRDKPQEGHTATYTYMGGGGGLPVEITTVLHIFRDGGDWWVKYRTSYASAAAPTAAPATTAFIEALRWPPSP